MKKRTRARELALQFLYQIDVRGRDALDELDAFLRAHESDRDTSAFAAELVRGTVQHGEGIDECIRAVAQNWEISRMAVVDRNALRLATFELLHREDIPPKVSINEAIELAKRYSTANSGGFVNGVLDKVRERFAPPQPGSAPADPTRPNQTPPSQTPPSQEAARSSAEGDEA